MNTENKQNTSSILQDIKKKPHKSPGQKRQQVVALLVILVIGAIGLAAYFLLIPQESVYVLKTYDSAEVKTGALVKKIQAGGSVSIPLQMSIHASDMGDGSYIQQLNVRVGDVVKKGQVLATFAVPSLEEQLRDLMADYEEAMQNHEQFLQQNTFNEARIERELSRLANEIEEARLEVGKQEKLVTLNASRKSDYDRAVKTLDTLIVSQQEKLIQLEETRILNRINESSRLSALDRYQKSIERVEAAIAEATIRSPIEGEILFMDSRLTVPGSSVLKGQTLFTVADRSSAIIELEVSEQHAGLLSIGQRVPLVVGGKPIYGTIDSVGRVASLSSDGITATVRVSVIPQEDSDLIPGSTAVSELIIGSMDDILLLPRGPYLTTGGQRYVYVIQGNQAVKTAVTFGELQTDQVQILRGLSLGDRIITSGYQNYIEHTSITLQGETR